MKEAGTEMLPDSGSKQTWRLPERRLIQAVRKLEKK